MLLLSTLDNPAGIGPDLFGRFESGRVVVLFLALGVIGVPALGVVLLRRLRRSRGVERQQFKWVAAGGVLAFVAQAVLMWFGASASSNDAEEWPIVAFALASTAIPLAIGIAILRYRLYEIDRIISRTISSGVLTAVLVAVFASVVVGLQTLLSPFTGGTRCRSRLHPRRVPLFQPPPARPSAMTAASTAALRRRAEAALRDACGERSTSIRLSRTSDPSSAPAQPDTPRSGSGPLTNPERWRRRTNHDLHPIGAPDPAHRSVRAESLPRPVPTRPRSARTRDRHRPHGPVLAISRPPRPVDLASLNRIAGRERPQKDGVVLESARQPGRAHRDPQPGPPLSEQEYSSDDRDSSPASRPGCSRRAVSQLVQEQATEIQARERYDRSSVSQP